MRRLWGSLLPALVLLVPPTPQLQPMRPIAIRNVTVLPMTGAPPIARATVVIEDGRISAVGPDAQLDTRIYRGSTIIDGTGKFLMPGLIEMHAHLSKTRASAMGLFVANGVTTVRDVGGDAEELLRWRREVNAGTRVGPRMLMAGPYLESARNVERMRKDPPEERAEPFERTRIPVGTPDEARRIVAELAGKGVDLLKIRTVQDRETYLALNEAANAHKLPLVGHVSSLTPPDLLLQAGQDGIEHPYTPPLDNLSREQRMVAFRQLAARGVAIVPTLVVIRAGLFTPVEHLRAMVDDVDGKIEPRRPYLSAYMIRDWREQLTETTPERQAAFRKFWDGILRDVREMHEAGMELLAGSDVAVLNIFPGSSLHDELELFVTELKMTPADALERATRRSAQFLGIAATTGTIAAGKIADLLLLDANPLQDIRHTRRIAAVVLRGTVYDRAGIDGLLAKVRAAQDIRVDDWGRKPTATRQP